MGGLPEPDELFEVAGDKLAAVVADDPGPGFGEAFPAALGGHWWGSVRYW